jgi:hypothetical protein
MPDTEGVLDWATDVAVGALVQPNQVIGTMFDSSPMISVPLTPEQRVLVNGSSAVRVHLGAVAASAVVTKSDRVGGDDGVLLALEPGTCPQHCEDVVPGEATVAEVEFIVVPSTTGVVVPTSTIQERSGRTVVEMADGSLRPVAVVASARGTSVIEGVISGEDVVVPSRESR